MDKLVYYYDSTPCGKDSDITSVKSSSTSLGTQRYVDEYEVSKADR